MNTDNLITAILTEVQNIQERTFRNPEVVHINTGDMQNMANEGQRRQHWEYGLKITICHGDVGALCGMQCVANDEIPAGEFRIIDTWSCPPIVDSMITLMSIYACGENDRNSIIICGRCHAWAGRALEITGHWLDCKQNYNISPPQNCPAPSPKTNPPPSPENRSPHKPEPSPLHWKCSRPTNHVGECW